MFINPAKSSPDDKKLFSRVIRPKVIHIDILNSSLKMLPDRRSVKNEMLLPKSAFSKINLSPPEVKS